jgi:hypothetical protein
LWYPPTQSNEQTRPSHVELAFAGGTQAVQELPHVATDLSSAHREPHAWKPELQSNAQPAAPLQVGLPLSTAGHAWSHEPQWSVLVAVSTQVLLHNVGAEELQVEPQNGAASPGGMLHTALFDGHGLHDPQCSDEGPTQRPPQKIWSDGHAASVSSMRASTRAVASAAAASGVAFTFPFDAELGSTSNSPRRLVQAALAPTSVTAARHTIRRNRILTIILWGRGECVPTLLGGAWP